MSDNSPPITVSNQKNRSSMLARSALFRLMLVLPVCLLFWLGVWWALGATG